MVSRQSASADIEGVHKQHVQPHHICDSAEEALIGVAAP